MKRIYLDNAATTAPYPAVLAAMSRVQNHTRARMFLPCDRRGLGRKRRKRTNERHDQHQYHAQKRDFE